MTQKTKIQIKYQDSENKLHDTLEEAEQAELYYGLVAVLADAGLYSYSREHAIKFLLENYNITPKLQPAPEPEYPRDTETFAEDLKAVIDRGSL